MLLRLFQLLLFFGSAADTADLAGGVTIINATTGAASTTVAIMTSLHLLF